MLPDNEMQNYLGSDMGQSAPVNPRSAPPLAGEPLDQAVEGYVEAIIATKGFWSDEDETVVAEWEAAKPEHFTDEALSDIAATIIRFWTWLQESTDLDVASLMRENDYSFDDLGSHIWCESRPDFSRESGKVLDEALDHAFRNVKDAHVEIGSDGRIRHYYPAS